MLSNASVQLVEECYTDLPDDGLELYHGTATKTFYSKLCLGSGFTNQGVFTSIYATQNLGNNAVYGPGLYLTDNLAEANDYANGNNGFVVKFTVDSTTNYLDMSGHHGTQVTQHVGKPKWHILGSEKIYALIKVTAQYYVLRTPFNVTASGS